MFISSQEVDFFLEHHGVKGMKWGVHRERRLQSLERAGVKGGSKIAKVRALGKVGPVDFIKGHGITGAARRKSIRMRGQFNRFDAGEATTRDLMKRYGTARVSDLIPSTVKGAAKKTSWKADVAVVGATFVGLTALNPTLASVAVSRLGKAAARAASRA